MSREEGDCPVRGTLGCRSGFKVTADDERVGYSGHVPWQYRSRSSMLRFRHRREDAQYSAQLNFRCASLRCCDGISPVHCIGSHHPYGNDDLRAKLVAQLHVSRLDISSLVNSVQARYNYTVLPLRAVADCHVYPVVDSEPRHSTSALSIRPDNFRNLGRNMPSRNTAS